jgi:hypothetical protein
MFGKKQKHRRKARRKSVRISELEKNEEMRQLDRNGPEIKLIRLLEVL